MCPEIEIPERFEQVVLKALAKDPLERYQSMGELREAIEDAFAKMPSSFRVSSSRVATALKPAPESSALPKSARKNRERKQTKSPDLAMVILFSIWAVVALCLFAYANMHEKPKANVNDQADVSTTSDDTNSVDAFSTGTKTDSAEKPPAKKHGSKDTPRPRLKHSANSPSNQGTTLMQPADDTGR
jgi:cytoskeletal protein RodZ